MDLVSAPYPLDLERGDRRGEYRARVVLVRSL